MKDTTKAHILMILLVISWGFDYVPAKWGLESLSPMSLLFLKYCLGFVTLLVIRLAQKNHNLIRKKDIPLFLVCALFGEVLYFYCEYNAMNYLPVALLTIILGFVPVLSIILERILYGRKPNRVIVIGITLCIIGIIMVIGSDWHIIFEGRIVGYLLAFGAVVSWNIYNFITSSMQEYDSATLSCTQLLCSLLMIAPIAIHNMPNILELSPLVMAGIGWIGIIDSGIGFMIMVYGLQKLGPTTISLYSDFLPVSTTFFGVVLLHESITWLQAAGGIIVVAAAFAVIREKGKLDEQRLADPSEK